MPRRGQTIVVREVWRDRLWSAVPHIWVQGGDWWVTYLPRGTVAAYVSNKGLPGTEAMTREQRKIEAMRTCNYHVVERSIELSMLHFFMAGSWARVNLGWTAESAFTGWYVNFETPISVCTDGLETKDLVLDMHIAPDGAWKWKDRDSFDAAVAFGLFPDDLRPTLETAAEGVLAQHGRRIGPFDPAWLDWSPDPYWVTPALPVSMRVGGAGWTS